MEGSGVGGGENDSCVFTNRNDCNSQHRLRQLLAT